MSKKQNFGQGSIISIYRFMEYCGLECPKKENVLVSHKIMMRKLELRKQQFPDKIQVPRHISFNAIKREKVYSGVFFLVKDDYDQILPYFLAGRVHQIEKVSQEELARRREAILSTVQTNSEEMSEGYKKYLFRKNYKELEEQKLAIMKMLKEQRENPELEVTEKITRYKRVNARKYAY